MAENYQGENDVILDICNITKAFDDKVIIDDLSFQIKRNEFITLLGPSGCGKTTTLRIIGGFEHPDEGKVLFDGVDITQKGVNINQIRQHMGMVFQHFNLFPHTVFQKYALFPHMTVAQNVAFGLQIKKMDKKLIAEKVSRALRHVNLAGFEDRKPASLSGGQQQRVAIARAIVNEPKVLLLDEPLGALDLKLRQEMQRELIRLKNELGITFIYVTHDQEEALTMSDRIIVMNQGYIQQIGTPIDIYNEPENAFVADFIGESNILDGIMVRDRLVTIGGVPFPCVDTGFGENQLVDVVLRPEDVELVKEEEGITKGVVRDIIFKGVHYEINVDSEIGITFLVQTTQHFAVGTKVGIRVAPDNIQIMHKPESDDEMVIDKDK